MSSNKTDSPKTTFFYLFLFALICMASVLILRHDNQQKTQNTQHTMIDSFVSNAKLTEYNDEGKIKTIITAESAVHSEPTGITTFQKPFIVTYTKDRTPWHIRADNGTSDKNGDQIELQQHVILHQLATSHHVETRITTDALTIYTKDSRATTDKPVTLSRPGMVIHGVGLSANFKTGEYQLHSQSEAIYQPSSKRN